MLTAALQGCGLVLGDLREAAPIILVLVQGLGNCDGFLFSSPMTLLDRFRSCGAQARVLSEKLSRSGTAS